MSVFHSLNVTASALTAQRLRMDVVASNMGNADTTRAKVVNGKWVPYQRKMVELQANENSFSNILGREMKVKDQVGSGVNVTRIVEDKSPFKIIYKPEHPDADENGYVQMPNVDPLKEMVDLMGASRSYEANVTVFNASKGMLMKALEIGK